MARKIKESIPVNIKMKADIAKMLEDYSFEAGMTKTIIIERSVKEYIEKYTKNSPCVNNNDKDKVKD